MNMYFPSRKNILIVPAIAAAVLVCWAAGRGFAGTPTETPAQETVTAESHLITETYSAVGTVKPRSEIRIESQVSAQVKDVHVQAGDIVKKGDLLITLDNRQARTRLDQARQVLKQAEAGKQQARQTVKAAEAAFQEAEKRYQRVKSFFESQAATRQEFENAESARIQARAGVDRARQALTGTDARIEEARQGVEESRVALEFSTLTAPSGGEVIRRMAEPGDMALPGRPLMALRARTGFRIEAHVREGLIRKVRQGITLEAEITSLDRTCQARVEEIIPYADPQTRTFLVKAALPDIKGLYPGMYAKLYIPASQRQVVMVPRSAVTHAGQLEMVQVRTGDSWRRVFVTTGHRTGDRVEVLSGLDGGEILAVKGAVNR